MKRILSVLLSLWLALPASAGFTEWYVQTTGSNLNAGSTTGDSAAFTYASGSWVASTGVFTVASGNPSSDGVAVGDWASVYPDGSTVAVFIGRVTARDTTTITVSLTIKSGTAPTDGTSNRTLKIGGAWKGPNGTEVFPWNFMSNVMTNSATDVPCVNIKSGTKYDITATLYQPSTLAGPIIYSGYTTTPRDDGVAVFDGGGISASVALVTNNAADIWYNSLTFTNNGTSGNAAGVVSWSSGSRGYFRRVTSTGMRGAGFYNVAVGVNYIECESFENNIANQSLHGGWYVQERGLFVRCIAHHNRGTQSRGFMIGSSIAPVSLVDCIASHNGGDGFTCNERSGATLINCLSYSNTGDGLEISSSGNPGITSVENCIFARNAGYGINNAQSVQLHYGTIRNCWWTSGSESNVLGHVGGTDMGGISIDATNLFTINTSPWVDAPNGDFRLTTGSILQAAGRGSFVMRSNNFTGTISYPDIGPAQIITNAATAAGAVGRAFIQ